MSYDDHKMIIGHRNYRSYDEVMIKLPYDEFSKIWSLILFACLFKCSLFNIFVYGSCIYLMNTLVNWLIIELDKLYVLVQCG